jgi:hypothetical protein
VIIIAVLAALVAGARFAVGGVCSSVRLAPGRRTQHRPGQPGPQRATVCFPARGSTRSSNAPRSSPGSR